MRQSKKDENPLWKEPYSDIEEVIRLLIHHPEMRRDLGTAIRRQGGADRAVRAMRRALCPQFVNKLFTPPQEQIARLYEINTANRWPFTEEDFSRAAGTIPPWPEGRQFACLTLVPYFDSRDPLATTFQCLMRAIFAQNPSSAKCFIDPFRDGLRLIPSVRYDPGLRWVAMDLGAHWPLTSGAVPSVVRGVLSPHLEILAAALLHPEWFEQMDGKTVPNVCLPGMECHIAPLDNSSRRTWMTPQLRYFLGPVISYTESDRANPEYAIPEILPRAM